MSITYESIILLRKDDAGEAIRILREEGERAALNYLRQWHQPGEGTLISTRSNPWQDGDLLFEDGDYVLYCNFDTPYIGLVCRADGR